MSLEFDESSSKFSISLNKLVLVGNNLKVLANYYEISRISVSCFKIYNELINFK